MNNAFYTPHFVKQTKQELHNLADLTVNLELSGLEAYFLLAQLQLALRHPKNSGRPADYALDLARQLSNLVATTPALAALVQEAWPDHLRLNLPREATE